MPRKAKKKSLWDRVWSTLRSGPDGDTNGKADAVFVCRLYRQEDGSWETVASVRHWLKDLPTDQKNAVPAGIPGAIMKAVAAKPIQKHLGGILKNVASAFVESRLGPQAAQAASGIIDTFTDD